MDPGVETLIKTAETRQTGYFSTIMTHYWTIIGSNRPCLTAVLGLLVYKAGCTGRAMAGTGGTRTAGPEPVLSQYWTRAGTKTVLDQSRYKDSVIRLLLASTSIRLVFLDWH